MSANQDLEQGRRLLRTQLIKRFRLVRKKIEPGDKRAQVDEAIRSLEHANQSGK